MTFIKHKVPGPFISALYVLILSSQQPNEIVPLLSPVLEGKKWSL